jgi:hypothetical protein
MNDVAARLTMVRCSVSLQSLVSNAMCIKFVFERTGSNVYVSIPYTALVKDESPLAPPTSMKIPSAGFESEARS